MISPLGKTRKRKSAPAYSIGFVVFFSIVFFWVIVQRTTYTFLEPGIIRVAHIRDSLSLFPDFFHTYITSHKKLVAREKELEVTIEHLENTVAEKDFLLRQYAIYDEVSQSNGSRRTPPIIMYPLMKDITSLYSTILLSKGFKDGVISNDIVYVRGNQAVCSIQVVYSSSSRCLLYTSSGVITEGVTSSSSITLSLVGRGGHFIADVIRDTPVFVGEKVLLRSDQSVILGTVTQVANNNQDTSWHIIVDGAYNPIRSSVFYVRR
jgi:cell shape-determining protein MreC